MNATVTRNVADREGVTVRTERDVDPERFDQDEGDEQGDERRRRFDECIDRPECEGDRHGGEDHQEREDPDQELAAAGGVDEQPGARRRSVTVPTTRTSRSHPTLPVVAHDQAK